MTEREIKRKLEDNGYRIADVARHLAQEFPITVNSADTMLRNLLAGRQWFPTYVAWLKANYAVTVDRPHWLKPVRERMKIAA